MNHSSARAVIIQAFQQKLGRPPVAWEAQVVQGLCDLETNYGAGWQGPVSKGIADPEALSSNNWGAVQYGPPPPTPGTSFGTHDTHRNGSPYLYTYKIYPTPVDGAADVVGILQKKSVLALARNPATTSWIISQNIIRSGYSEGIGADETEAIRNHWEKYKKHIDAIAAALGERAMPTGGGGESPTPFREPGPGQGNGKPGPTPLGPGSGVDLATLQTAIARLTEAQASLTQQVELLIVRVEAALVRAVELVDRQVANTTRLEQLSDRLGRLEHQHALNHPSSPP